MKTVLVVDDTKNIKNLLTTCLTLNGYSVLTASNGFDAMEILKKNKVNLVFLDIKMPELSGTEVLKRIRAMGIDTPVIIMTAFATVKNAVECTKLGAVTYLQKPFTTDKVKSVLKEIEPYINENSLSIDGYIMRAKELMKMGELDDAFDILKKALCINVNSKAVYELLGNIYELRGDNKEAERFKNISNLFDSGE
ncbi:tetratricopeptide repeat protein [Clostridium sp. JN-9]|uniref:tetratricopeptide repeat protein n=1 Tax=Clostridium sp. JN-9 TaxID=2507159 RepID=UPI000FFE1FA6|nr:tetratricopeptide repeat protein [Clostridium sp. JN-9]QAT39423.1 response regulator [Clostridium sp. JN-9]